MLRRFLVFGASGDLASRYQTTLAPQGLASYGRLLLDVLRGDPALSISSDEAEESWAIVEPILAAWRAGPVPLIEYPAGSDGPRCLRLAG